MTQKEIYAITLEHKDDSIGVVSKIRQMPQIKPIGACAVLTGIG